MQRRTPQPAQIDGGAGVSAVVDSIISRILKQGEKGMRQRYQDPKILKRSDVSRPFYYVLAAVPVIMPGGVKRMRQSHRLGFCDEISLREAKARKQQLMARINAGLFMIQSQFPFRNVARTFEEAAIPQLGSATQEKYHNHLHNHLLPAFGDMLLCEITRPTIESWLNRKAEPHTVTILRDGVEITKQRPALGWWARNDLRNLLSAIFTKAKEWNLWDGGNPCAGVRVGAKKVKRTQRIPKPDDLLRFLEAIRDTSVIDANGARLIVITAVVAGLRVSEVLGLQPQDIDVNHETLRVERRQHRGDIADPKSESSRRIRQIGMLAHQLLQRAAGKAPEEFIFVRNDRDLLDDRYLQRNVFRPAAEAANIYFEGFGMHVFRRLNVTWRQEVGATPIEAQKAAGHASLDMTYLYTVADEDREREHVRLILERLKPGATAEAEELAQMPAVGGVQ
jgi:integrase